MSDEMDLRQQILEAICSVRVPVEGAGLLYAAKDGTMPLYDADEDEAGLIADAVLPLLAAAEAEAERLHRLVGEQTTKARDAITERDDLRRRLDRVLALNERWRRETQESDPEDVLSTAGVVRMIDHALDAPNEPHVATEAHVVRCAECRENGAPGAPTDEETDGGDGR